ncbi:hypothetical protein [Fimbriiglobus ruber]|uniref:Uncharacterized protein n=1 Tax=Fimbriiglobus ruber TaxID=1908690 RepID=A0A225DC14_9BACT|nr:hypothetical protein [Fimbriiglobus ruber]OWK36068.1 hypothetical protein FRUB_08631 [Fimbriiglobus ruber]
MNSTMKYVVLIGLIMVVVFGVTIISINVETPGLDIPVDSKDTVSGVPLSFSMTAMVFDPAPPEDKWPQKYFQGFYEIKDEQVPIPFWFQNRNSVPVRLSVTGRSCTACTRARVGIVPAEALRTFKKQAAMAALVQGALPVPDLATVLPAVALFDSMKFQELEFDQPGSGVDIPAADADGAPTLGVFQMMVKVNIIGPKPLHAMTGMRVGNGPPTPLQFDTVVLGVQPCLVHPKSVPLGELPEGAAEKTGTVVCWSATRGFEDFPPPTATAGGKDPFIHLGAPVKMTDVELSRFDAELGRDGQHVRAISGYTIPYTVYRRLPDAVTVPPGTPREPDIGPFERFIDVAGVGNQAYRVPVTATVTGLVNLTDGKQVDFEKSFATAYGASIEKTLASSRTDLALEVLADETTPRYLKATLSEPRVEAGRKLWTLKVTVPPNACSGPLPPDSAVVLRGKTGGEVQKVRVGVKGAGR